LTGFNDFYDRGTNGFNRTSDTAGTPDTAAKYILKYAESTVVTPSATGTPIEQLAYRFHEAESVRIPVTANNVTITNTPTTGTVVIDISGTNALQVLGAQYNVTFAPNFVQDELSNSWPHEIFYSPTPHTTEGINRPFVRVDKRVNQDRVVAGNGSNIMPNLQANFGNVIQTRARLDCRTPGSNVRYNSLGAEHTAANGDVAGIGVWGANPGGTNNPGAIAYPTVTVPGETTGGTTYNVFTGNVDALPNNQQPNIVVGDAPTIANITGYTWRIAVRSTSTTGTARNSASYEEAAFRTVLTYYITGMTILAAGSGQKIGGSLNTAATEPGTGAGAGGDQIWIRGGDGETTSSIPGYPLRWTEDDYNALRTEGRRAGVRLLQQTGNPTNSQYAANNGNAATWKWVSWEINAITYFEAMIGRHDSAAATYANTHAINTTNNYPTEAWQYGPRFFAAQRGGWSTSKVSYPLVPGKHRWLRIANGQGEVGGPVNYAPVTNFRPTKVNPGDATDTLTPSMTQPN
jgi:hypothetical protein